VKHRMRSRAVAPHYVAVAPLHAVPCASGPDSNTGLASNSQVASKFALCVDYCTLVFSEEWAAKLELNPEQVVEWLFPGSGMTVSPHELRKWQFYPMSSYVYGPDGSLVGRVGSGGNAETVCVSLSGAGCALVKDWLCTVVQARRLRAHLSRVDVAFDDFEAETFGEIREVNTWAITGQFNAAGHGKPCATRFMDDHGKGAGSTVYVGSRGRKQLCVYEKGKQLGDPLSPWIRCELRLWAADCIIPLDVLVTPGDYLRGAYALLAEKLPAVSTELAKPERLHRAVKATAEASIRFLRQQCGPTLDLLIRSVGPDVWTLLHDRVLRSSVPRRFRGMARNLPELRNIVRQQLGIVPPALAV
jgi:phage replication initiation protein